MEEYLKDLFTFIPSMKNAIQFLILLFAFGCSEAVETFIERSNEVGTYEDYKPSEPIKFSHSLHSGEMEIDCKYCHSSAEKSKHAVTPSVNVCMNCHDVITNSDSLGQ